MDEEFDTVILALATLLECDPAIVRIYYEKHKISEVLDTQESSRLLTDANNYSLAFDKVRSARAAISNLSNFEKAVLSIQEFDPERSLRELEKFLSEKVETRRAMRAEYSIQGGKNVKANAVANMVLDLFLHLKLEINLTKTSATKHTSGNAPSSHFARCVNEALKITHTDGRRKNVNFKTSDGETAVGSHVQYAHWQEPARQAIELWKNRTSKK
ncbi:MAG: hypothetical protein HOJ68_11490 [Bacteroidetes bacterium]|jgi:hypothetical protein|nr:hypothetical protein [Bacteroidota bacterium]MDA7461145.1 hypothetical protein [Planktomarina temperata]MDA8829566.1 hypothetical protein [Planktomarina temperata]MDC1335598.1 hypothetical protein [Planktomarina temperata]